MHKSKKKSSKSSPKLPKPIKVKKEKTEEDRSLHAMSHYVDDRLELIKQIFGTLKPKTITNLAPEFLKKKNMVEIEELCLNELLCISTKRLLSIINATKCPTDTESDEDSDIQHQEEHISLEEISSDSDIDDSATGAKKINGNSNNRQKLKKDTKKSTENHNENDGQISVLELLELQARARAIRSQLALEPVTKIEVDSGDEAEGSKGKETEKKSSKNSTSKNGKSSGENKGHGHKRKSTETERLDKMKSTRDVAEKNGASTSKESSAPPASKKIKLKRNYRNTNQERSSTEINSASESASKVHADVKREQKSRSPSPDVIPIVHEPETLLISDSDAEEPPPKDNKTNLPPKTADVIPSRQPDEETEEGEITDTEPEQSEEKNEKEVTVEDTTNSTEQERDTNETQTVEVAQPSTIVTESESTSTSGNNEKTPDVNLQTLPTQSVAIESAMPQDHELIDDDADNDDVISIGGDLESEMNEHLEKVENTNSKSSYAAVTQDESKTSRNDDDVISLGSSVGEGDDDDAEDEKKSTESWHARYIKSSKVSKVLAASRLSSKVRDNIKKTKRSKKDEPPPSEVQKPKENFSSQHEDGSVEQYKELLRLRKK